MQFKKITSERLSETIYTGVFKNGLNVIVYPMEGYSSCYAIFGTNYGSIDNCFKTSGDFERVPDGIAHFLEHKLFENEDCDAFARYAVTGASANAYTSFDKTCYLFSCTQNFEQSLTILLDFVQSPYFTQQTVEKEQGIIGQEIRMYDDDPNWQAYFSLLRALYQKHSVNIDIAGTIQSIAEITAEHLYKCYHAFYNPANMVLCVAGNITPEQVANTAEKLLKDAEAVKPEKKFEEEPLTVASERVEKTLPVATPIFCIGYKEKADANRKTAEEIVMTEIIIEAVSGKSSSLFRSLRDKGLISDSLASEYFEGPGYASVIFSGESSNPDAVKKELDAELEKFRKEFPKERFEAAKRLIYGNYIKILGSADNIANLSVNAFFSGYNVFDSIECAAGATLDKAIAYINSKMKKEYSSISIVKNKEESI